MLTPQQVQETTLERAVFGGYTVDSVDDFLEPLTEDYITLYKENAVLKSKMRVLVEKLEEYRGQESAMNNAIVAAQKTCNDMIAEAQRKCARMISNAEAQIRAKSGSAEAEVSAEEERVNRAKASAAEFIQAVEEQVRRQLDALKVLKQMDLTPAAPAKEPAPQRRAYDYEAEEKPRVKRPSPPEADKQEDIADEIKLSLEKLVGGGEKAAAPDPAPQSLSDTKKIPTLRAEKFANLQFGKNYDPTSK